MKPNHHLDDATLPGDSAGAPPAARGVLASTHLERGRHGRERLLDADWSGDVPRQPQRVSWAARTRQPRFDLEPDIGMISTGCGFR